MKHFANFQPLLFLGCIGIDKMFSNKEESAMQPEDLVAFSVHAMFFDKTFKPYSLGL